MNFVVPPSFLFKTSITIFKMADLTSFALSEWVKSIPIFKTDLNVKTPILGAFELNASLSML